MEPTDPIPFLRVRRAPTSRWLSPGRLWTPSDPLSDTSSLLSWSFLSPCCSRRGGRWTRESGLPAGQRLGWRLVPGPRTLRVHNTAGDSMIRSVVARALCLMAVATAALAQASRSANLTGVWRTVEARDAAGRDITDRGERNMYIFTQHHFSIAWAEIQRPKIRGVPNDSQKVAMWQEFGFQAGTYEISGDTLTLRSEVAKSPQAMEPRSFQKFLMTPAGSAIWLQLVADNAGPLLHQERVRLVRAE
jgi:hypothetical protein